MAEALRLDLANKGATRGTQRIGVDAGDIGDLATLPVDRAPLAVAFGPGDAAETRREIHRRVELRFDRDSRGRVHQPPLAVFQKRQEPITDVDADALGADIDPGLAGRREDRALAIVHRQDRVVDIAENTGTRRNRPGLILHAQQPNFMTSQPR